jgi:acyl-CoA thioesterase I
MARLACLFVAVCGVASLAIMRPTMPAWAEEIAPLACMVPNELTRLDFALERTARRLSSGEELRIVAIGSSSTAGAGASSPAAAYPSRLEAELRNLYPNQPITVVNAGVNGERAQDMIARFDSDVIAAKADLVVWQVGSNSVLRDDPLAPAKGLIHDGIARLKAAGADVVLMNPQFAPRIVARPNIDGMVGLLDAEAKENQVGVFRRYSIMRHWRLTARMPFRTFLSADELHLNDWSYRCLAELLAISIAEAATRSANFSGNRHDSIRPEHIGSRTEK